MTQEEVAFASGIEGKQLGSYVRGAGNPTLATLLKLSDGLNVSFAELAVQAAMLQTETRSRTLIQDDGASAQLGA